MIGIEMTLNWLNIRTIGNSLNLGFEEFVTQLARKEDIPNKKRFIRKGSPDAGVECFWILEDDSEWAWQAKYFISSLTSAQWGEIDTSVRNVIQKHKNVEKYIISMPIDPPDARIEGQTSLLQKWDEHVDKWEEWAEVEDMEIEFIPWWASDLIERLQRPENSGLTYFWFNKEEFTDEWCKEQVGKATVNLGNRYTSELNVELDIAKIFNGLSRNENFRLEFRDKINILLINLKKYFSRLKTEIVVDYEEEFYAQIDKLVQEFNLLQFDEAEKFNLEKTDETINKLEEILQKIENKISDLNAENEESFDYRAESNYLNQMFLHMDQFKDFINGVMVELTNEPYLLLNGKPGIGKSHLLADVANKIISEGENTILLLGQHFTSSEDPWTQIFKQLKFRGNEDEFLGALESKAQIKSSRFIIFIDAVNEGKGKIFWPDHLSGFIKSFEKYKWLGLVLSIRDSYINLIAPVEEPLNSLIIRYPHPGFGDVEYHAIKLFYDYYNIEQPTTPFLNPEFQNPLFLKLFCEGLNKSGLNRIPDGMQGITKIMNFFTKSINKRLSSPKEFNYHESINIVSKVINILVEYKIENDLNYIPFEEASTLIVDLQAEYNIQGNFIGSLISEGILSEDLFWKENDEYESGIYITYERFDDHIAATYLLNNVDSDSLQSEFYTGGRLHKFTKDIRAFNHYNGIIEALSIQLPEKFEKELYEVIPEMDERLISVQIAEAFVSSLLWRKYSTITEKVLDYIKNVVFSFPVTYDHFWDTLISVAPITDHLLNGDKTHEILIRLTLADRDECWTRDIHYGCSYDTSIKRLIEWAWSTAEKNHISDESIRLASIMLAWFLTSTNRRLRDSTTKALVCLLKDRINVLIDVLVKFEEVNDPYIYERLFAVAYGCILRTHHLDFLKELSEYIYKTIFDKDLVYPHVLLRDYARNTIEYVLSLDIDLNIDVSKIRPPYSSNFPSIPDDEQIKDYEIEIGHDNTQNYKRSQNMILHSMEVEHTREGQVAPYGDFGRYVFQGNFRNWKTQLDVIDLKNIAIRRIFDLGYDVEKHGRFDDEIQTRHYDRNYDVTERIGKKYQWIAMHELLAQVSDNFKMKSYCENSKGEELVNFQGPWNPFIRDIDPTVLRYKENSKPIFTYFKNFYDNFEGDNESWLEINNDYPDPKKIINYSLDSNEWVILEGNIDWDEPELLGNKKYDIPQKLLWYQIRSYIVKEDNFELIIQLLKDKNFMGRWMPESYERGEIFNREFYWSPAYNYFLNCHEVDKYAKIIDENHHEISEVIVTTEGYTWESSNDHSNEKSSSLKPCYDLFSGMQMEYGQEGIYLSQDNEKICYDLSGVYSIGDNLVINKVSFLNFLNENNYQVFWTLLGEKNIIGDTANNYGDRWPSVSGVYYFDDKLNLTGNLNYF